MVLEGKRFLGIDPGSGRVGHGLIEIINGEAHLIGYGCIETTPNSAETHKLKTIYEELTALIANIKPDHIAVEMLFFANNAKTASSVGQARGVILLVAAQANIPVFDIAPLKLKKTLLGSGTSKKKDVQHFIKDYFGLEKVPKPDDAADAISIALCQTLIEKYST